MVSLDLILLFGFISVILELAGVSVVVLKVELGSIL